LVGLTTGVGTLVGLTTGGAIAVGPEDVIGVDASGTCDKGAGGTNCVGDSGESTPTARPTAGSPHPTVTNKKPISVVNKIAFSDLMENLSGYAMQKPLIVLVIITFNLV